MTQPTRVDPDILHWFTEPRSGTQVSKESGWHPTTVWNHMRLARRMGLIAPAGKHKDSRTSCHHKLYEVTPRGIDYLEEEDAR